MLPVIALLVALSGCSSATALLNLTGSPFHWKKAAFPTADAKHPVGKIICIWEPAEGHGLDGLPTRGFAGQVLFFTQGNAIPARVEGDVRIYLFDDQGTPEEQAKPIHQFDFLGDAWTVHMQRSTLGPAYSVFVPYVRKSGMQTTCALRVRLTPKEGPTVFSETVHVTLPGRSKPADAAANSDPSPLSAIAAAGRKEEPVRLSASLSHKRLSPGAIPSESHPSEGAEAGDEVDGPPSTNRQPQIEISRQQHPLEIAGTPQQNVRPPQPARRFQLTSTGTAGDNDDGRRGAADEPALGTTRPHPLDDLIDARHPLLE